MFKRVSSHKNTGKQYLAIFPEQLQCAPLCQEMRWLGTLSVLALCLPEFLHYGQLATEPGLQPSG